MSKTTVLQRLQAMPPRAAANSGACGFASVLQPLASAKSAQPLDLSSLHASMPKTDSCVRLVNFRSTKIERPAHRHCHFGLLSHSCTSDAAIKRAHHSSIVLAKDSGPTRIGHSHAPLCSSPAGIGRSARAVGAGAAAQQSIHRRRRARDHGDQGRAAEVPAQRRGATPRGARRHPTSVQRRRDAPATKNVTATRRGPRAARRDLDRGYNAALRRVPTREEIKLQAPFNSGSLAVGVGCCSLDAVARIARRSCPSLPRT